jgi:hypothetical protein
MPATPRPPIPWLSTGLVLALLALAGCGAGEGATRGPGHDAADTALPDGAPHDAPPDVPDAGGSDPGTTTDGVEPRADAPHETDAPADAPADVPADVPPDTATEAGPEGDGAGPDACDPAAWTTPVCVQACTVDADCDTGAPAGGSNDADNFRCLDGACRWQGCQSDQECAIDAAEAPWAPAMRCVTYACGVRLCMRSCSVPADCPFGTSGVAYDADNYACDDGLCRYVGCHDDAECATTFASERYRCRTSLDVPTCWNTCASPADCASPSPAYDADNYACDEGFCVWQGCHSAEECAASYQSAPTPYTCGSYYDVP